MKTKRSVRFSRRRFLKTAAGGVAGATLAFGAGCENGDGDSDQQLDGGDGTDTLGDDTQDGSATNLFSKGRIGNLELKNRLIRSATEEAYCDTCIPTDKYIEVLTNLAKGGVGMIIPGVAMLTKQDALSFELGAFSDDQVAGLANVRNEVRSADPDCKLVAQIGHTGHRYASPERIGPSDISWPGDTQPMRPLSVQEIGEIVDAFAQGARRFKEAGWDGIELHGAHGYLISTFLSPYTNQRTDDYGGSVQKRVQIVADIMEQTRKLVGPDFPILIKLNSDDSGGYEPDDLQGINQEIFVETAKEIEKFGVDAIDVSGNDCVQFVPSDSEDQSFFKEAAIALDLNIPVILTGGNRTVPLLENLLSSKEVQFFGLSRPLVREPDLPNKWLRGETEKTKCISCSLCAKLENIVTGIRCHQEA